MKITNKNIILLLLFISSLDADYLLTINTSKNQIISRCILNHYTTESSLFYEKSIDNNIYYVEFRNIDTYTIKAGYYLNSDNQCLLSSANLTDYELQSDISLTSNNLSFLGLEDRDLNMAFALSGILISFLFLFGLFRFI